MATEHSNQHPLGAAGWTLLSFATGKLITVSSTLVLAHILRPRDFGLVALAALIILPITALSELGLGQAIVIIDRDPATLRTTFALLLAGGVAGTMLVIGLAAPLSSLFGSATLEPVLFALSSTVLLGAITAFYAAVVQRELAFKRWFATQLAQAIAFGGVSIAAAVAGADVWSLVAGQIAAGLAYAAALAAVSPYHVRPRFSQSHARSSMRAARGFLAQHVLEHFQHNLDVAAIGYTLGSSAVGYYSMSYRLADLPYQAFTQPIANAAFPRLAALKRRDAPTSHLALEFLGTVALFACPAGLLISATAPVLVPVLFGPRWQPAVAPMAILGVWSALVQVEAAWGWILNATGHSGANALLSGFVLVPLVPALLLSAHAWGIVGVAWTMLASAVVTGAALTMYARRRLATPIGKQARVLLGVAVSGAMAWASARAVVDLSPISSRAAVLGLSLSLGVVIYLATLRLVAPASLRRGSDFACHALRALRPTNGTRTASLDAVGSAGEP